MRKNIFKNALLIGFFCNMLLSPTPLFSENAVNDKLDSFIAELTKARIDKDYMKIYSLIHPAIKQYYDNKVGDGHIEAILAGTDYDTVKSFNKKELTYEIKPANTELEKEYLNSIKELSGSKDADVFVVKIIYKAGNFSYDTINSVLYDGSKCFLACPNWIRQKADGTFFIDYKLLDRYQNCFGFGSDIEKRKDMEVTQSLVVPFKINNYSFKFKSSKTFLLGDEGRKRLTAIAQSILPISSIDGYINTLVARYAGKSQRKHSPNVTAAIRIYEYDVELECFGNDDWELRIHKANLNVREPNDSF